MAYDEALAHRIRAGLAEIPGYSERRMFGGLCFMVNGNMVCGLAKSDFMARIGADKYDEALSLPHTRPMDFTGKPMKGIVYVGLEGVSDAKALRAWLQRCLDFATALPPK